MTTYGHDPAASALVAMWGTGDGAVAHKVARVPPTWGDEPVRRVADGLTVLSARLWRAYADEVVDDVPLGRLADAVRRPYLPIGDLVQRADDDRVEIAHEVGRIVADAPGRAFRAAVVRDVAAECEAVRAADRGDLCGRAQQGVEHPRSTVPDAQLAAAHALLHAGPLGSAELVTSVEPTAAGVVALRWLRAASGSTAALVGHAPADVIALAEAIEHEDLRVARFALAMLAEGTEVDVVQDLLREAVLARRGHLVVCPDRLEASEETDELGHRVITTVLDPHEPGRSLVGGLVRGIQGCFRVYVDEVSARDDLPTWAVRAAELRERFCDDVRSAVRSLQ